MLHIQSRLSLFELANKTYQQSGEGEHLAADWDLVVLGSR
jgi:hypothetical protein